MGYLFIPSWASRHWGTIKCQVLRALETVYRRQGSALMVHTLPMGTKRQYSNKYLQVGWRTLWKIIRLSNETESVWVLGDPTSARLARWVSFSCDWNAVEDEEQERSLGRGNSKYQGPEVGLSLGVCRERRLLWLHPEGERDWRRKQRAVSNLSNRLPPRALKSSVKNWNFVLNSEESCGRFLINK